MSKSSGFTLIELMMVTGIIGVLAAISLPVYQDYTTRARVVEALNLGSTGQKGIDEYYKEYLQFPVNNQAAGIPAADKIFGNNVASVEVADGAIHVTFQDRFANAAGGSILTLRPAVVNDSPLSPMSWICGYQEPVTGMTAIGENRTDIPTRMLPSPCRS